MSLLMEAIIGFPSRASCKPIQMGLHDRQRHTRAPPSPRRVFIVDAAAESVSEDALSAGNRHTLLLPRRADRRRDVVLLFVGVCACCRFFFFFFLFFGVTKLCLPH